MAAAGLASDGSGGVRRFVFTLVGAAVGGVLGWLMLRYAPTWGDGPAEVSFAIAWIVVSIFFGGVAGWTFARRDYVPVYTVRVEGGDADDPRLPHFSAVVNAVKELQAVASEPAQVYRLPAGPPPTEGEMALAWLFLHPRACQREQVTHVVLKVLEAIHGACDLRPFVGLGVKVGTRTACGDVVPYMEVGCPPDRLHAVIAARGEGLPHPHHRGQVGILQFYEDHPPS